MATAEQSVGTQEEQLDKGLKSGALGLISTTVIATASVAPAYSIAATLVFVVAVVGLQAPAVSVLAFVPMLLTSIGYSELNKADPDCGTTFTWATRAFGPRTGWFGGWAIVVADGPRHRMEDRRGLRDRGRLPDRRDPVLPLLPVHQAGRTLLQEADPDPVHPTLVPDE
jgi:hypothetical protein